MLVTYSLVYYLQAMLTPTRIEPLRGLCLNSKHLPLPKYIRHEKKLMERENTLAYWGIATITALNSFMATGVNFTKIFCTFFCSKILLQSIYISAIIWLNFCLILLVLNIAKVGIILHLFAKVCLTLKALKIIRAKAAHLWHRKCWWKRLLPKKYKPKLLANNSCAKNIGTIKLLIKYWWNWHLV